MARPRKPTPTYAKHRDKARATWTDAAGVRHFRALPGAFGSTESRQAYGRLLLELETEPAAVDLPRHRGGLYVVEIIAAYLEYARQHYRGPDGRQTSTWDEVRIVLGTVNEHYGQVPASDFGPLALKAVRQAWVARGLARVECNRRVGTVRRMFKWAVAEELIPFDVYHRLTAVAGLQKGRTSARETEPVGPVDDATVDATLPHLNRQVAGMVRFQRLVGCRPQDVCGLRLADIDTTGAVWTYRPPHHKGSWRGKERVVSIGPRAQAIIREYATDDPAAFVFSPARAVAEIRAARSASRQTPKYPSHMHRNKEKRVKHPKRRPAQRYTSHAYGVAVSRAVERANKLGAEKAKEAGAKWEQIPEWTPNQLRHAHLTRVRERYGLEAAQAVAGHERADVTQVYAKRIQGLAATVAAELG